MICFTTLRPLSYRWRMDQRQKELEESRRQIENEDRAAFLAHRVDAARQEYAPPTERQLKELNEGVKKKAEKKQLIWLIKVLACFGAFVLAAPFIPNYLEWKNERIEKKAARKRSAWIAREAKAEAIIAEKEAEEEAEAQRIDAINLARGLPTRADRERWRREREAEREAERNSSPHPILDKWRARKILKVDSSTTPVSVSYLEGGVIHVERVNYSELQIVELVLR